MKYATPNPTIASLFDGIGGFPLAASRHGIEPVWASEIEKFPIEVTKHHFPDMLHLGDITKLKGGEVPITDIVSGGSPCQDLSVAGKRAGLDGARSGLFMEQIRLFKEMREADKCNGRATKFLRPRYFLWENVPGVFSIGEPLCETFRIVLEEICRIGDSAISVPRPPSGAWEYAGAILGVEFSVAWRVYDTQYWPGTPQRRRRVYLVADFGGHTAPQILFEQARLFGNIAPGGETRESAATETGTGAEDTGGACADTTAFACNQRDEVRDLYDVAAAVTAHPSVKQQTFVASCLTPWDTQQQRIITEDSVSPTLACSDGGGGRNPGGLLFAAGVMTKGDGSAYLTEGTHATLSTGGGQAGQGYPCVMCLNDQGGQRMDLSENISGTLRAQDSHQPVVLEDAVYCIAGNAIDRQPHNGGNGIGVQPDISYTLDTSDRHAVFARQRVDVFEDESDVASTQSARQYKDATDLVLHEPDGVTDERELLIRKLTPLECERLQGYPDFWTDIPGASDSARYKALGNSVAIPCVEHVMRGVSYFLRMQFEDQDPKRLE